MWYYLFSLSDGRLITESNSVIIPDAGEGVKSYDERQTQTKIWDSNALDFVAMPTPPRFIDKSGFLDLFTDDELKGIIAAGRVNADVELLLEKLSLIGQVDLNSTKLEAGLQMMEAAGILSAGRAAVILNG